MADNTTNKHDRLRKQLEFIIEVDKVKSIFRRTRNFDSKRYENDAEHAWHMSLMAVVLSEYANEKVDLLRVVKMALIHDLVEIDVGDTFLYAADRNNKAAEERACAQRVFGLLPEEQRDEFLALWEEFEAKETAEARFAGAIDRLEPLMQNWMDAGHAWKKHGVSSNRVMDANRKIELGSTVLWERARVMIEEATGEGPL